MAVRPAGSGALPAARHGRSSDGRDSARLGERPFQQPLRRVGEERGELDADVAATPMGAVMNRPRRRVVVGSVTREPIRPCEAISRGPPPSVRVTAMSCAIRNTCTRAGSNVSEFHRTARPPTSDHVEVLHFGRCGEECAQQRREPAELFLRRVGEGNSHAYERVVSGPCPRKQAPVRSGR